jgi:hypothetical protein
MRLILLAILLTVRAMAGTLMTVTLTADNVVNSPLLIPGDKWNGSLYWELDPAHARQDITFWTCCLFDYATIEPTGNPLMPTREAHSTVQSEGWSLPRHPGESPNIWVHFDHGILESVAFELDWTTWWWTREGQEPLTGWPSGNGFAINGALAPPVWLEGTSVSGSVQIAPEPGTLWFSGLGVLLFSAAARRVLRRNG